MPVTLEIAGRAVSRLGNAAVSVPVVVRNAITLAAAWSGVTDNNGYFVSPLLDDAAEYRAEVEYDTTNHYKTLRDLASGQMNMLQVRKRFHVHGAVTPCVIDGPATIGGTLGVAGNATVGGALVVSGGFSAAQISIGGQTLDDRFINVGDKATAAVTADNALALGGVAPAGYSPAAHSHPIPANPSAKAQNGTYTGNGANGNQPRVVFDTASMGGGIPVMAIIWEGGAGAGAFWIIGNIFNLVGQANSATSDEVINATGFVQLLNTQLVVNNNPGAAPVGNNGLNANLNGVNYEYCVIWV